MGVCLRDGFGGEKEMKGFFKKDTEATFCEAAFLLDHRNMDRNLFSARTLVVGAIVSDSSVCISFFFCQAKKFPIFI